MTKSERTRLMIWVPILAVALLLAYLQYRGGPVAAPAFDATGNYQPMTIENPSLRFDLLASAHAVQYTGTHRNIFDDKLPVKIVVSQPTGPANGQQFPPAQQGPPPLVFPMKCFGFVEGPAVGMRRAFFTDGEDVFIAGIGDTIVNRFRLVRIGNESVEVEELGSNRRATVQMEQDSH
jgi:hypothetical protein